jgi:hypothetical protein
MGKTGWSEAEALANELSPSLAGLLGVVAEHFAYSEFANDDLAQCRWPGDPSGRLIELLVRGALKQTVGGWCLTKLGRTAAAG